MTSRKLLSILTEKRFILICFACIIVRTELLACSCRESSVKDSFTNAKIVFVGIPMKFKGLRSGSGDYSISF